jgi:orotidine-5'-phosphate decarboxylase
VPIPDRRPASEKKAAARYRLPARERLIVALDVPNADLASRLAEKLHGRVGIFKVGSEIFTAEGPALVRHLVAKGEKVFLDLKFHDIPNTVRGRRARLRRWATAC